MPWATLVEIRERPRPTRQIETIKRGDWSAAHKLAKKLADSWSLVQPSNALRSKAVLVERYDLRAADALQLAAALGWCEDAPQGRVFLTADRKLREAALLKGFDAEEI